MSNKVKDKDPRMICMKDRNGKTMDVILTDWMSFYKEVVMHDIQFPVFIGIVTDVITKSVYVLMCDYRAKSKQEATYGIKIADVVEEEKNNE